jgi:hypothetical protein
MAENRFLRNAIKLCALVTDAPTLSTQRIACNRLYVQYGQTQRRDVRRSCILRPLTDLKYNMKAEKVVVQGENVGIGGGMWIEWEELKRIGGLESSLEKGFSRYLEYLD